jgi:hypothetical protein
MKKQKKFAPRVPQRKNSTHFSSLFIFFDRKNMPDDEPSSSSSPPPPPPTSTENQTDWFMILLGFGAIVALTMAYVANDTWVPKGAAAIELRNSIQSIIDENRQVPGLYEKLYDDLSFVAPNLFFHNFRYSRGGDQQVLEGFARVTTQCTCPQFREIEALRKVYLRWSPPHAEVLGKLMDLVGNRSGIFFSFGGKNTLAECLA